MFPNVLQIKSNVKPKILNASSGIMLTTVIYLLLTDWLSDVLHMALTNPLDVISDAFANGVQSVMGTQATNTMTMPTGITPAEVTRIYSAALQTARELFSQPANQLIALLFLVLYFYGVYLSFGYSYYSLRTVRGEQENWKSFFVPLWNAGKLIALNLITSALIGLGLMMFVLPAVFFFYSLRLAPYVALDNPELSIFRVLRRSTQIVKGHRFQLFLTDVSFLGWMVACSVAVNAAARLTAPLSSGVVGTLAVDAVYTVVMAFVLPYREMTIAKVYDALRLQDLKTERSMSAQ